MTSATAVQEGQTTYVEAISQALDEEMTRDERVFLMGEDIGAYGGAFKVTQGFL
jgi:2-oxoisovalerate dehydrogenase E1 component beta subunit